VIEEIDQSRIFAPVFTMIALTFAVWVYLYIKRIPFILRNNIALGQLQPDQLESLAPPDVANPSHNLKNLFEIPVLFYALALIVFSTGQVDTIHLATAWIFVGLRILHSLVHCTFNLILLRFYLYLGSTLAIGFMSARAALQILV